MLTLSRRELIVALELAGERDGYFLADALGQRTGDGLHAALGPALGAITAQDAQGCFRHAGYGRPD
jgi:hypothetical protein